MGKLVNYVAILIFIDLFFIITGQIVPTGQPGSGSISSILFNAILNVGDLTFTELFKEAIGNVANLFNSATGIAAFVFGSAVTIGAIFTRSDSILYAVIGFSFSLLTADFVFIFAYLSTFNVILATMLMAPMALIYVITVVEWVKGRD